MGAVSALTTGNYLCQPVVILLCLLIFDVDSLLDVFRMIDSRQRCFIYSFLVMTSNKRSKQIIEQNRFDNLRVTLQCRFTIFGHDLFFDVITKKL